MNAQKLGCALAMTIVATACGGNAPATGSDAGIVLTDAGRSVDGGGAVACTTGASVPRTEFGTSEGSNFSEFPMDALTDCRGTPFSFYSSAGGYCEASFTVISLAAGWCGPCRMEAPLLREFVNDYAADGVRVIQVVIQNNSYRAADTAFCQGWVDQYGFENTVLIDPLQETQIYFPMGALPANLIVDNQGVIRHREYGVAPGLGTLRAALDRLLAGG